MRYSIHTCYLLRSAREAWCDGMRLYDMRAQWVMVCVRAGPRSSRSSLRPHDIPDIMSIMAKGIAGREGAPGRAGDRSKQQPHR